MFEESCDQRGMKSMIPALEFTGQPPKAEARPRRRRRKIVSPENPKVRSVALANQPMDSEEIQLVVRGAKWVSHGSRHLACAHI